MKVNIQYPIRKCALCGKEFERKHNRQIYCSKKCAQEGARIKDRKTKLAWFYRNKQKIYQTQLGTRTISQHPNPNPEREAEIIKNEKQRLGLTNVLNLLTK